MPDKKISIFDFYFDMKREWVNWKDEVKPFETPEGIRFSKILVPTIDTKKYSYIINLMIKNKFPCMFVGESGTAKSVIIANYLNSLSSDHYMKLEINFSSRTTSKDVQANLEDNIEKRSGRIFGPKIVGKQLIIMIDDLHMPKVDTYGTQQPIALLKFFIEKSFIYERVGALEMKIIKDTQVVSALLPPSVATSVDPRLLSLFTTYNLIFPSQDNLLRIYNSILSNHLKKFSN
jgi:dynein heavy chain